MDFLKIERSVHTDCWSMQGLHAHPHYEIYYIYKGSRQLLLTNALTHVEAPALVVIPPDTLHKTEGGLFSRYNIDVGPACLNAYQLQVLHQRALQVMKPSAAQRESLLGLLREMEQAGQDIKNGPIVTEAIFGYFMVSLSHIEANAGITTAVEGSVPPLVLKVIDYLYAHYPEKLSLDGLAAQFYVSKATILYNFNRYLHTTPMDFLLRLRLAKAKETLLKTDKTMGQIAEACGFGSANYFSLIFKRKEQLSPANYRKYQREKK